MNDLQAQFENYEPHTIGEHWSFDKGYEQGRTDREKEIEKAFKKVHGSEYSWYEIVELANKLKELKND